MIAAVRADDPPVRRRIAVRGVVQGVGFRPFVWRLASELALDGFVRNDAAGVVIEVQGGRERVERMARRIAREAPPRARVDAVDVSECAAREDERGFAIVASEAGRAATAIGPDGAICADCLAELFDPADRRYRYAFVNCTNCGPRYTITHRLPYDRATTSMAAFAQCPSCAAEYASPRDRRFHAEPNACPRCGPRLALLGSDGRELRGEDPIAATVLRLARGEIVAIKGLGGFHLACDARNATAVARLRERKAREEKPFAVMVAGVASVTGLADVGAGERALLESAERPIVLLRKSAGADEALAGVAPGLAWLGAMLPYTPLQFLLFHEAAGRPAGTSWLDRPQALVLVMTSANPGGEPLVTGNGEALVRLAGLADAFLVHDRDIVARCDDSVVRIPEGVRGFQFVRRARGYTPQAIRLARGGPSVVAVGGWFKNTVCVTRGDEAFVSQHIGDLDNAPTCAALAEAILHLVSILEVRPAAVAHDLHPDFFSTRHAAALAARWGVPLRGVQHHHAHVAAVLAEHRVTAPALGLALDGVGLGTDGAAWGGELLRVDGARCERLGRLRPLRLPGGDRAAREPWRMAAAALALAGRGATIERRFAGEPAAATVAAMLARGVHAPETSSLGRWFDAAAGLLGVRRRIAFEGQAAMLLEGLAERHGPVAPDASLYAIGADNALDLTALGARLADIDDLGFGAALFHATVVEALAEWVAAGARRQGLATVAGAGGCFLNAILARGLRDALARRGLALLEARAVPPNDGGLSLGQAWVALDARGA
ncbi:MAG TPA: carbamoyltransferase HypF [Casimicrobiaceae bacterium]|nr:carbamoyltransferase HypF [Casimicrobiaceae bacterium]